MALCSLCGGYYETPKCPCAENRYRRQNLNKALLPDMNQTPPNKDGARFTFEAGRLVRSQILSQLKGYFFLHNLEYTVEEDRGWLESTFRIEVRGSDSAIADALSWVAKFSEWLQKEQVKKSYADKKEVKA